LREAALFQGVTLRRRGDIEEAKRTEQQAVADASSIQPVG
jgi:hypothetical protein